MVTVFLLIQLSIPTGPDQRKLTNKLDFQQVGYGLKTILNYQFQSQDPTKQHPDLKSGQSTKLSQRRVGASS